MRTTCSGIWPQATAQCTTCYLSLDQLGSTTVVSDGSGNFSATSLAAGQYVMCAEATTQGLLDPCHWAVSAPSFTLTDGQAVSGLSIVMAKGAVLMVHLD